MKISNPTVRCTEATCAPNDMGRPSDLPLAVRLADGLRRRIIHAKSRWLGRPSAGHAAAAFERLPRQGRGGVGSLDATLLQVKAAFDSATLTLPTTIDLSDGRMQAAVQWMASGDSISRVVDVGCGTGRFLRNLQQRFPHAALTGVDISLAMLKGLPAGVEARQGSMLDIPAGTGEFDAALAVESLEHSLLPRQAVTELCRIVRPGGRILIIDKDRARQALSRHEPWEQWFAPQEVAGWLAEHCEQVRVERIPHGTPPQTGLFLAWTGIRR